ncbi:MAG: hypothetical protein JOZ72_05200 [Alphaproteobacteria bacterium]|nr:hypothetical protein [Alphaproteobacteria bacterium]
MLHAAPAWSSDLSEQPVDALVGMLTSIDADAPGIDDAGMYDSFLADDAPPQFRVGQLPLHPPTIHPAMRELVRRGAAALPALLAHLDDVRPTRLAIGREIEPLDVFGGQFFADEYDPRRPGERIHECPMDNTCRSFDHPYRVRVGDVCEVLIGQIVNRRLYAVRYQPTQIVYVNSPVETPALAALIRKDWTGVDSAALAASLREDLHGDRAEGALRRLRFYYPRT